MTTKKIREVYEFYRGIQRQNIKYEEELLAVSSEDEWLQKLSQKSTFLRTAYQETEVLLNEIIYPYIKAECQLSEEEAKELFFQAFQMSDDLENDGLLVTEIFKLLLEFYKGNNLSNEILSYFYLGVSYADRVNPQSNIFAHQYLKKLSDYKDVYSDIDWHKARGNYLNSFFNRIANFEVKEGTDWQDLFDIYEETCEFCRREIVCDAMKGKLDTEEFIEDCADTVKCCITATDLSPTKEVLDYVKEQFLLPDICDDNYGEQSCYDALLYVWYQYHIGQFDCNKVLQMIYNYYMEKDKEIDYSDKNFYDDDKYQVQMVYIKECFRYLAKEECTLLNKGKIREKLVEDFAHLYESIPYLENNAFLNMDMLDIMQQLLRSTNTEEEAFKYVQGVAIQRNAMTLIHSTMLAQIATSITKCLLEKSPELFYEVLDVNTPEEVMEQTEYLLDYIEKSAYIHDVGKVVISDVINLQTRRITNEEFGLIKCHPEFGANLIKGTILEEKYSPIILGHHKFYNGKGGYPESFDNTKFPQKVLIDILTISDCIDAATDILGRNYTSGKTWIPVVRDELREGAGTRYNEKVVNLLCNDLATCNHIQYLTSLGRVKIYYNIYQKYLAK